MRLLILKSVLEYDVTLIEVLDRGKAHCNHSAAAIGGVSRLVFFLVGAS